jgi:UDP-N-acetylmuramyl tripeptide synthase
VITRLAVALARLAGWLSRVAGRGGGTTVPGLLLLKVRPAAVSDLAAALPQGSIAISATNGKTTTARLVVDASQSAGLGVAANPSGSNLLRGVATALLESRNAGADVGVFEVDEAALPATAQEISPGVVVLMNLFRDQLDRYGELEGIVDSWSDLLGRLPSDTTVIGNADDPAIVGLLEDRPGRVFFGVADTSIGRPALPHAADTTRCRHCESELVYGLVTIGHMGHWHCPNCDWRRPEPDVTAEAVQLAGLGGQTLTVAAGGETVELRVELPGLHNSYNVTAALATTLAMGLDLATSATAMSATRAAFGRAEKVEVGDRRLVMLLAKNPTGANENVQTLLLEAGAFDVLVILNDRTADGQDVSWIWDVDYEPLIPRLASLTLAGDRAYDLALRFRYAGMEANQLTVVPDIAAALDAALAAIAPGSTLYALPTYTAMLDLRAVLVERGITHAFWEDTAQPRS